MTQGFLVGGQQRVCGVCCCSVWRRVCRTEMGAVEKQQALK